MKFSILKSRKPRKFDFPSRYYDPKKEELERRVSDIQKKQIENNTTPSKELSFKEKLQLQNKMNASWRKEKYQDEVKKSNKRVLYIMVFLLLLLLFVGGKYL